MIPKRIVIIGADYPELEKYCPNWEGMRKGLARLEIPFKFVSCRPSLNIDQIVDFDPDLIVYGLADMVKNSHWRREIKARLPSCATVIWYGDYRDDGTGQYAADCSDVDAMFVSNDAQQEFYKKKWRVPKVHFLPLGCEPLPAPRYNAKFALDFVFIGGQITSDAFRHRASLIENFKLQGGLKIINSFTPGLRLKIYKAMPEIYSSAKVCLDISHFTHVLGYTSIRYWEIPAFHGFALTQRWPGCEQYYPPKARAYFDGIAEAIEKKDYFLRHETERLKILAESQKYVYNNTYDKRFLKMFELL